MRCSKIGQEGFKAMVRHVSLILQYVQFSVVPHELHVDIDNFVFMSCYLYIDVIFNVFQLTLVPDSFVSTLATALHGLVLELYLVLCAACEPSA